jgi:hypothetical protein
MSIFDPTSGMNPTDWLQEKSLAALETAVKLIDLANEPDTTPWYEKNLKRIAEHLISRLVPMTALFHGVAAEGVKNEEWRYIVESGTFALTKWCRKWNIANPYRFSNSLTARERDGNETIEKSQSIQPDVVPGEDEHTSSLKLYIYSHMTLRLLRDELTKPAKRLMAWALFHLYASEYADIVVLNKAFLPTDIGCTPKETGEGYRQLYRSGLIEKIEGLDIIDEAIALRLVVDGLNDSKHAIPFQEETFGRQGLRIRGEPTTGNIIHLTFHRHHNEKYLEWLACSPKKIQQLHDYLQQAIGNDHAYIEDVGVIVGPDETNSGRTLEIVIRYPLSVDDRVIEYQLERIVEKWIKETRLLVTK